jgi:hypothetical protein
MFPPVPVRGVIIMNNIMEVINMFQKSILFIIFTMVWLVNMASASPNRLQGMSLPDWSVRNDWESVTLSPAFITRLDGSRILMDLVLYESTGSETYNSTNFTQNYNRKDDYNRFTLDGLAGFISKLDGMGFGLLYNTSLISYTDTSMNTDFIPKTNELKSIDNSTVFQPVELTGLFGIKIGDSLSLGIAPKYSYFYQIFNRKDYTNGGLAVEDKSEENKTGYGADIGINYQWDNNLAGIIGGFSYTSGVYKPSGLYNYLSNNYEGYYNRQAMDYNGGVILELADFKGIAKISYSYNTEVFDGTTNSPFDKNDSITTYMTPYIGAAYNFKIFENTLLVCGAIMQFTFYHSEQIYDDDTSTPATNSGEEVKTSINSTTFYSRVFAGMESKFNTLLTGRFGLSFSPYYSFNSKRSVEDSLAVDGTLSNPDSTTTGIMNNWSFSAGITATPIENMAIDLVWSSTALSGGWENNKSKNNQYVDLTDYEQSRFNLNLALAFTYKI